jgi:hypothetical protein
MSSFPNSGLLIRCETSKPVIPRIDNLIVSSMEFINSIELTNSVILSRFWRRTAGDISILKVLSWLLNNDLVENHERATESATVPEVLGQKRRRACPELVEGMTDF